MKKPIFIEIDEKFALRRSTIISVEMCKDYGYSSFFICVYFIEGREVKKYITKSWEEPKCEKEYKRILEVLK